MNNQLKIFQAEDLLELQQRRAGETRLGQLLQFANPLLPLAESLNLAKMAGCRYVLLGIPEDIGPRANFGAGGADLGFRAFLSRFLNLQANEFIDPSQILLLGEIYCADLQLAAQPLRSKVAAELEQLRSLCAQLDQRVSPVVQAIFENDLVPIVIGGGHNNALPILQALAQVEGHAVDAVNLDPHCDFRLLEGRHSGNGFSYAKAAGWLDRYYVLGLHQLKNSAASLQQLAEAKAQFCSYQQIFVQRQLSWPLAVTQACQFFANQPKALGLELDTDSISGMPVSAMTNCGLSVADAEYYVATLAKLPQVRYLHLAEGAPAQHPAGLAAGNSEVGQVLSALVLAFLQNRA